MGSGDSFTFDVSVNVGGNVSVNAEGNARIVIPSGVTVNIDGNFQLDQKNSGCSSSNPCIFEIVVNGTLNISQNFQNNLARLVWSGSGTVTVDDNFENSSNGCMDCGSSGCPGFESDLDCNDGGVGCSAGDFCTKVSNSFAPQITGQTPISINQGESVTITFSHLTVTDPDDNYPTGFTLSVYNGAQYTVNGATVTPSTNFSGNLKVQVSVNDGENESNRFELTIEVKPANTAPQITGQVPISINQGESVTITFSHLTVTDPDDTYPTGFTLSVYNGAQYTVNGATVTPSTNFSGNLKVQVSVNDGENESNRFELTIEVKPANTAPQITGQVPISINQGESVTITFSHLTVTDPDDNYPTGFTLSVYNGAQYTVNGATVTPSTNFSGNLKVQVSVNDGENESNRFELTIEVKPANTAPQITGQVPISINQGESVTITFSHLTVTDPDDTYPTGFTLSVYNGAQYTVNGATVTPSTNFSGNLKVQVSVNDGENESNRFELTIEVKPANTAPQITGQVPITINQGKSVTITFSHLTVTDPDDTYPTGFTLSVYNGAQYTVNGATVTPSTNFSGNLKVQVSVNDGENESNRFELTIEVKPANTAPQITGQVPISINQGESVTITFSHLTVTDPDDNYPTGFTLSVYNGAQYTVNGATVTPSTNFSGNLKVQVSVNDGENESNRFELTIEVKPANTAPQITGQVPISINQGESVTITFSHLTVTDPDDPYPTGFTLSVYNGAQYTVNGATVTPSTNFSGNLKVQVSVNDGENESNRFELTIEVKPANTAPQITGQVPISINQGESVTITFSHLTVTDPDDPYPTGFTLSVYNGAQYTVNGATVTPSTNFSGNLKVQVSVNDGENESNRFELTIEVKPANTAPQITGQVPISINQGESVTITFSHLTVTDPDDTYPTGFTLSVYNGAQYTVNGATVTPSTNFSGNLKVQVSVNDGENESNRFELTIEVKPANTAPQITGQLALTVKEDESIAIKLTDLSVVDPDNNFPQDFTLKISAGSRYAINGNTVVPEKNYSGPLSIVVRVNDGKNDSPPFDLQITVVPVNDSPIITGQKQLSANQGTAFSISLSDLTVADPDNSYPDNFTLKISPGNHYVAAGNAINPTATFVGILNVIVSVNDGTTSSPVFSVQVQIIPTKTNVAPTIVGQKAISITQNNSITLQLFHLTVIDPDNEYPAGFSLKVFPGTSYKVTGLEITPAANFVNGTLRIGVQVNDGLDDSQLFELKIQVTPISATPRINGQKELIVMEEDSSITITLSDLIVTDSDNPNYPQGFTLRVLPNGEGVYSTDGNTIRPAPDLNGLIEVGVTVSDGVNTSAEFRLSVLVIPVNDAPLITLSENSPLIFEPGNEPVEVFRRLEAADVDNEYLSMAEIGFRDTNHSPENDELLFESENARIRGIKDIAGTLFLIGNATVDEYQEALRTIKYNYLITEDSNGKPEGILSGPRTIYINVSDGLSISLTQERKVDIQAKIELDIPNAFTPNGDNVNDTWHVQLLNRDKLVQAIIKVYNKRGLLLYEADGFEKNWDATFNGERLPTDTYYYTIVIKLPYARESFSGVVTVLY